ncbi:MAG: hypothetical protein ACK47B_05560 [Armatimonadota bacterium]
MAYRRPLRIGLDAWQPLVLGLALHGALGLAYSASNPEPVSAAPDAPTPGHSAPRPAHPSPHGGSEGVDLAELGRRLQADGLKGTIHGADPTTGAYVFTWWNPESFFESVRFSMVPASREVAAQLAPLERHQEVTLRGRLLEVPGTQPHLRVESLQPGKKWDPGVRATVRAPEPPPLERALAGKSEIHALVHAVDPAGGMLLLEYAGHVVPVRVPEQDSLKAQAGKLYRGDRVRARFRIAETPSRPLHLILDPQGGEALRVTDRIAEQHRKQRTLEGRLVLFPRSPVLNRSIWGVEVPGPDGLNRYYTLFNLEDLKDQDRTDAKLQSAWRGTEGVEDARNKYLHTRVRVRARGTVQNPDPNQANPTLVVRSDQVEVK